MSKGWEACTQCSQPHSSAWIQPDRTEQTEAHRTLLPRPRSPRAADQSLILLRCLEMWKHETAKRQEEQGARARVRAEAVRAAACTDALVKHTHFMHGMFIYSLAATQRWHFPVGSMNQVITQSEFRLLPFSCVIITGNDQVEPRARTQNELSDSVEFFFTENQFRAKMLIFFLSKTPKNVIKSQDCCVTLRDKIQNVSIVPYNKPVCPFQSDHKL